MALRRRWLQRWKRRQQKLQLSLWLNKPTPKINHAKWEIGGLAITHYFKIVTPPKLLGAMVIEGLCPLGLRRVAGRLEATADLLGGGAEGGQGAPLATLHVTGQSASSLPADAQ